MGSIKMGLNFSKQELENIKNFSYKTND